MNYVDAAPKNDEVIDADGQYKNGLNRHTLCYSFVDRCEDLCGPQGCNVFVGQSYGFCGDRRESRVCI